MNPLNTTQAPSQSNDLELLSLLLDQHEHSVDAQDLQPIPLRDNITAAPLSFGQRRLWFIDRLEPGNPAYNIASAFHLKGELSLPVLRKTLAHILDRHEILRTSFELQGNEPIQHIEASNPVPLFVHDYTTLPCSEHPRVIAQHIQEESRHGFDLSQPPLLRVAVLLLSDTEWVVCFTMHHIISDGWSMSILVNEVAEIWNALAQEQVPQLQPLPIQYGDFAQWQQTQPNETSLHYWRKQLGDLPTLNIPTNHPRPAVQTFKGAYTHFEVPSAIAAKLQKLAQDTESTLFMVLLSAYFVLLSRYCNQRDFAIGSPDANRNRSELDSMIGFFVNTLVIRGKLHPTISFQQFLEQIKETTLQAYAHQSVPFEKLVETLNPTRDLSHTPLIETTFTLNSPLEERLSIECLELLPIEPENTVAKYPLALATWEKDNQLFGFFQYNVDLFEASHVEQLSRHFVSVLENITNDSDRLLANIPMVELERFGHSGGVSSRSVGAAQQLLPQTIKCHAEKIAVEDGPNTLTYSQLDQKADIIANTIHELGIAEDCNIIVCLERSSDWLASLWGVWKAGCVFVSVDEDTPRERLQYIIGDTDAQAMIVESMDECVVPLISPSTLRERAQARPLRDFQKKNPRKPAYIIYTSGSTGTPKGVVVSHQALGNLIQWHNTAFSIVPGDQVTQVANAAFDASVWEIWPHLCAGATLHIVPKETLIHPQQLQTFLVEKNITVSFLPTPVATELIRTSWPNSTSLRYLLTGGDRLPHYPEQRLPFTLVNNYGPSENAVVATSIQLETNLTKTSPPIGYAIPKVQAYVLDDALNPVPNGTPGELYLGGESLASGYVNKPDETASAFLPNPFAKQPGSSLYKTGDRVIQDAQGQLHFLGRADHQLSIRGFRVEPGEIENTLKAIASIEEAVVLVDTSNPTKSTQLIACIKTSTHLKSHSLIETLKERLPHYMVPEHFIQVSEFPLTSNGKIDRQHLLQLTQEQETSNTPREAPQTELERTIADTWQKHLSIATVYRDDDFFAIGGHSMLAARILTDLQSRLQIEIPMRAIFEAPRLNELAQVIEKRSNSGLGDYFTELPADFLEEEACLPKDISIANVESKSTPADTAIFITGATGFLGAFLCQALIEKWNGNLKLFCLVRARSEAEGFSKLKRTFEKYSLWQEAWSSIIVPLLGDLSQPKLGLSQETFEKLAQQTTHIYHNGAQVHFIHPYKQLKPANVDSTFEILRLATQHHLKPISYISSLSVLGAHISEKSETEPLTVPPGLGNGYAQTKWVAEKSMHHARELGFPITIHRPSRIIGDTQNGIWNTDDFACRMIQGCIQLGQVPEVRGFDNMVPVDTVAQCIVTLDHQSNASEYSVFHLNHPQSISWQRFVDLIRVKGISLETVSYNQWRSHLLEAIRTGQDNALAQLIGMFPPDEGTAENEWEQLESTLETIQNGTTTQQLNDNGISFPELDDTLLMKYLDFFEQSGFFN